MNFVKDENHKYEGVYLDDTMKKNAFVVFFLRTYRNDVSKDFYFTTSKYPYSIF